MGKNPPANAVEAGDVSLIPGLGRSSGEGNSNPLLFSPVESQGRGSLVGCRLWGRTESDMTEVT